MKYCDRRRYSRELNLQSAGSLLGISAAPQVVLSRFFDSDIFFSLHGSCSTAATDLYAVMYTEVLFLAREAALSVLGKYPHHHNEYVKHLIGILN